MMTDAAERVRAIVDAYLTDEGGDSYITFLSAVEALRSDAATVIAVARAGAPPD